MDTRPHPVPTLVVTGGWNQVYDDIATALRLRGAQHLALDGSGHRPQDDPRATAAIDSLIGQLARELVRQAACAVVRPISSLPWTW